MIILSSLRLLYCFAYFVSIVAYSSVFLVFLYRSVFTLTHGPGLMFTVSLAQAVISSLNDFLSLSRARKDTRCYFVGIIHHAVYTTPLCWPSGSCKKTHCFLQLLDFFFSKLVRLLSYKSLYCVLSACASWKLLHNRQASNLFYYYPFSSPFFVFWFSFSPLLADLWDVPSQGHRFPQCWDYSGTALNFLSLVRWHLYCLSDAIRTFYLATF